MESEEEVSVTDSELRRHERASELLRDILLLLVPSCDASLYTLYSPQHSAKGHSHIQGVSWGYIEAIKFRITSVKLHLNINMIPRGQTDQECAYVSSF